MVQHNQVNALAVGTCEYFHDGAVGASANCYVVSYCIEKIYHVIVGPILARLLIEGNRVSIYSY